MLRTNETGNELSILKSLAMWPNRKRVCHTTLYFLLRLAPHQVLPRTFLRQHPFSPVSIPNSFFSSGCFIITISNHFHPAPSLFSFLSQTSQDPSNPHRTHLTEVVKLSRGFHKATTITCRTVIKFKILLRPPNRNYAAAVRALAVVVDTRCKRMRCPQDKKLQAPSGQPVPEGLI